MFKALFIAFLCHLKGQDVEEMFTVNLNKRWGVVPSVAEGTINEEGDVKGYSERMHKTRLG